MSIPFFPVPIRLSISLISANRSISHSYIAHVPIAITSDDELANMANNGTGTANDPYIIADWIITGSQTHGISIKWTTKYFRVENCWIESSEGHGICGIFVENVASGTTIIINNTCNRNDDNGISLKNANFSTVTNNICNNNYKENGISLVDSGSSTVVNNTCNNNDQRGILLWASDSSIVVNNNCSNNDEGGIRVSESISSTLANNTCKNNGGEGIRLRYSDSSIIVNNTCSNNVDYGIWLRDSSSLTVFNNICNDNEWRFSGFWGSGYGIYLWETSFSTVSHNTCDNNGECGIFLAFSDNNPIIWNTIVENGIYGILLASDSANNEIHHNNFHTNGLYSSQAFDNGTNNQWYGNYWSDYSGTGSYLIDGSAGVSDPYPSSSPNRYSDETQPSHVSIRIGLFLGVIGLFVGVLFVNRRKISS
ncbi:MAG: right-handed parallel beta-helix repeat-containing protein [Candidatus Hodarchaeales archaeon]